MNSSFSQVVNDYHDNINGLAVTMLLANGLFGLFSNGSIIYIFYKEFAERTALNLICVSRALISIYILFTSFFLVFHISTILMISFSTFSSTTSSTKKHPNDQSKETKDRTKKNAMLFCQTVVQDSLYIFDITFTFKLSSLSTHRFWSFISGTFVRECLHSLDGFIMLMFNERLSLLKSRLISSSQTSMAAPQAPTMNQVRSGLSSVAGLNA